MTRTTTERRSWGWLFGTLLFVFAASGAGVLLYQMFAPPIYMRFLERARKYERLDRWEDALTEYEKARSEAALNPDSPLARKVELEALKAAGDLLSLKLGKLDEGAKRYFALVERTPNSELGKYALERLCEMLDDFAMNCKLALPFIRRYTERFPHTEHAARLAREAVRCYVKNGELMQAVSEAREFLRKYPKSELAPEVRLDMANALFVLERYEEAMRELEPLLSDPTINQRLHSEALLLMGRCQLERGFFEQALKFLKKALKLTSKPQVVQVYINAAKEALDREMTGQEEH